MGFAKVNAKEIRDWAAALATLAVIPLLWIGAIYVKNQRLEIASEMRERYVAQSDYHNDRDKAEKELSELWRRIGDTNSKLDTLTAQAAVNQQLLLDLKDDVKNRRKDNQ